MMIDPDPAVPLAADADCGTLPPKPQPAAAAADPNAMKENEEAGANLLLGKGSPLPRAVSWAALTTGLEPLRACVVPAAAC